MNKRFSRLIWLGAGTASEPAGLLNTAEQVVLVDAREAACLSLQQQYPQDRFHIQQRLLTVDGSTTELIEYNLVEYSAIHPITGLKKLFPGLKVVKSEHLGSTRITDFIAELALPTHNNLLIIDIGDSNLALLVTLQQHDQLNQFSEIHIQAGIEPLYTNAATAAEIGIFLQECGYLLQHTEDQDPDMPWLSFCLNPLWQKLQHAQQAKELLSKERDYLNSEKDALNKEKELLGSQRDALNHELEKIKQHIAVTQQRLDEVKADAAKELDTVKQQLADEKQQIVLSAEKNQQVLMEQKYQLEQKVAENEALHQQLKAIQTASHNEKTSLTEQIKHYDHELSALAHQRDQAYSQFSTLQQQHIELNNSFEQLKAEVQRLQAEQTNTTQQLTATEQAQIIQINKLQSELELANKQSAMRLEKIAQLEKSNRTLSEEKIHLTKQQQALKQEMLKAEAQIEIIKDLLLKQ